MTLLTGKTVIVVGVGPGLGAEVANLAHRDGANVVVVARSADRLEQFAAELDHSGERVLAVTADITEPDAPQRVVDAAVDRFGRVDALVPVAAYDTLLQGLSGTTNDQFREVVEVNLVAAMNAIEGAAAAMTDGGSVVLIGTQSMVRPGIPMLAYAASKGGLQAAMYQLVHELGPQKIRLNMVVPTWMWGPMVQGYIERTAASTGTSQSELVAGITSGMPLGDEVPADEDVAEAVVWLCSDRARMITGQTIYVNAGEYLH